MVIMLDVDRKAREFGGCGGMLGVRQQVRACDSVIAPFIARIKRLASRNQL